MTERFQNTWPRAKKGLTGENIDEEAARNKVKEFIGEDKIEEIISNGNQKTQIL